MPYNDTCIISIDSDMELENNRGYKKIQRGRSNKSQPSIRHPMFHVPPIFSGKTVSSRGTTNHIEKTESRNIEKRREAAMVPVNATE
jgi:hypothetical protein